jgi:hypothetical protein
VFVGRNYTRADSLSDSFHRIDFTESSEYAPHVVLYIVSPFRILLFPCRSLNSDSDSFFLCSFAGF